VRASQATAAAAAVAAAVIGLSAVSGAPSLVDRAYAAINAGDQVLHEVDLHNDAGVPGYYDRVEGWLLPADGRGRVINISGYSGLLTSLSASGSSPRPVACWGARASAAVFREK
jgi:hypothetical protein